MVVLVALMVSPIVASAASGLPATIKMDPPTAGPGEAVVITGTGFPASAVIELELVTPATEHALGLTVAQDGGYFSTRMTLPADAEPGSWRLVASSPDETTASYAFNSGPAAPAAAIDTSTTGAAEPALSSGNSLSDIVVMLVIAVLIAGAIGGVAYVYYQLKLAGRQPGMAVGEDPIWSGGSKADDPATTSTDEPAWLQARPDSHPTKS